MIDYAPQTIAPDALSGSMDFDCPFRVNIDGTVQHALDYSAPNLWNIEEPNGGPDVEIEHTATGYRWELLSGYTGQYGYNGPVMHASERLGSGMAEDIMSTPGVYVVCAVECMDDEGNMDDEPAGWAVARLA
jgi:hypothetical protein